MATLAELYEFLETKQDDSHLDSRFSYDAFLPVEQPKARLQKWFFYIVIVFVYFLLFL